MAKKNSNNLGMDIIAAFLEGVTGSDMNTLRGAINNTVDEAIDEVKKAATSVPKNLSSHEETYTKGTYTNKRQQELYAERKRRLDEERRRKSELDKRKSSSNHSAVRRKEVAPLAFPMKRVGETSSIALMVTGGVGLFASVASIFRVLIAMTFSSLGASSIVAPVLFTVLFAFVLNKGVISNKRIALADRYARLVGNKGYIDVDELAESASKPKRRLIRDLKKLLNAGFFPQGRLDSDNKTLILTDEVYEQYVAMKKNKAANVIDTTARVVDEEFEGLSAEEALELRTMIKDGEEYISKLHALNDRIPGEIITAKLSRLEGLLKEIFAGVRRHPEQMGKMHELMDYYLPTMLKLVEAYEEYDKVSEPGKDIIEAKKDIEETLDTINDAFKKLLNNLFKDSVWDVTTDAQVLKTMLAQKGLAENNGGVKK